MPARALIRFPLHPGVPCELYGGPGPAGPGGPEAAGPRRGPDRGQAHRHGTGRGPGRGPAPRLHEGHRLEDRRPIHMGQEPEGIGIQPGPRAPHEDQVGPHSHHSSSQTKNLDAGWELV